MLKPLMTCLLLAALADDCPASPGDGEHAALLELMEQAFAAINSRDTEALRALQLAQGTTVSFRPHPDGVAGTLEMRVLSNEAMSASIGGEGAAYLERWTGEPTVLIRGPIAVVWGEYEFLVDGEFSHCGVDSIDLVRPDGEWKIANWMWTVEKGHCPTAPAR